MAPSLRWAGEIALWGTELVAQGRMVPVVRGANSGNSGSGNSGSGGTSGGRQGSGRHRVRWVPALVGRDRLHDLVSWMPTAVAAMQPAAQADALCRSMLAAVVDAISRAGAASAGGHRRCSACQHPVGDRRGGAVRPRRPSIRG